MTPARMTVRAKRRLQSEQRLRCGGKHSDVQRADPTASEGDLSPLWVTPGVVYSSKDRLGRSDSRMQAQLHRDVLELVLNDAHVLRAHAEQLFLRARQRLHIRIDELVRDDFLAQR